MENKEIWKDIVGYEGIYQISNLGNIKSIGRQRRGERICYIKEKILYPIIDKYGYKRITLNYTTKKAFYIHRLVLKAFISNPENKPQVNHINGIKTDNRLENLEWSTVKENTNHAEKTGLRNSKGESNPFSKLSHIEVVAIKNLLQGKTKGVQIAKRFNVSSSTISDIKKGKRWNHI